jgi:membrane fusion protein (multidrug efflux system)
MKRSTKIGTAILAFFLIITIVIVGRTMIGNHFKKKFSKRPPPGIIVTDIVKKIPSENKIQYLWNSYILFKLNHTKLKNMKY